MYFHHGVARILYLFALGIENMLRREAHRRRGRRKQLQLVAAREFVALRQHGRAVAFTAFHNGGDVAAV